MSARDDFARDNLDRLYAITPENALRRGDRLVIFSDLHMGNGGRTDDFARNAELFSQVLQTYYLAGGHSLVLNGDIEELQRFRLMDIMRRWAPIYQLFEQFRTRDRLHRLVGNHDMELLTRSDHGFAVGHALRYRYNGNPLFVFHGHQTLRWFVNYNGLVGFTLRYLANPLRIHSPSVAHDSRKRFRTEAQVYSFAAANRVLTMIGHTHRPLFQSMSKVDNLRFEIERLCRKYPKASEKKQKSIETVVAAYRSELARVRADRRHSDDASLYDANLLIPCVFNSGTVIGKRGMTCLEIEDGEIALVHWFDDRRSTRHLRRGAGTAIPGTTYHRVEIKRESLDYIFARINLLTGTD